MSGLKRLRRGNALVYKESITDGTYRMDIVLHVYEQEIVVLSIDKFWPGGFHVYRFPIRTGANIYGDKGWILISAPSST